MFPVPITSKQSSLVQSQRRADGRPCVIGPYHSDGEQFFATFRITKPNEPEKTINFGFARQPHEHPCSMLPSLLVGINVGNAAASVVSALSNIVICVPCARVRNASALTL